MKNTLLILNPTAGKRRAVDYLPKITKKLEDAGFQVECRYTESMKNACAVTKRHGDNRDYIVCVGGDGTLKETICAIIDKKLNVKLGYIPLGTTNDFAHSVKIPTDVSGAVDTIINGEEMPIDIGDFNETEQFIYVSCFGNFCDVAYKAKQSLKNKIGRGAYYWETVKEIIKVKGYNAKIECDDGEIIEGEFFYGGVSNSYSVAGFPVLTKAGVEFDDGFHELALIKMPKNPAQLMSIVYSMFVTQDVMNNEYIIIKKGKNFKFYFEEPVNWTLDGENGGDHDFVEVSTKKHAVTVMVNK